MEFDCYYDNFNYIRFPAHFIHKKFDVSKIITFCLDTGAPDSFISYHQSIELGLPYYKLKKLDYPTRIGGTAWDTYEIKNFDLKIESNSKKIISSPPDSMYVLGPPDNMNASLPVPGILGYSFLKNYTFVVSNNSGRVYFTDKEVVLK